MNNNDSNDLLSSSDDAENHPGLGAFLFYFVQILYGLVFLLGLVGNSLVIYVVLRYNKMQTVTNLYILNLAIADQCFLIGIPFIMTTMGLGFWPFGNVMCKVYMTTTSVNQFTSSLLLTVMSADRYIAVCHPITSPTFRTPLIAKVVSLTTWAVSFLMIVPIFLYASTQQVHNYNDNTENEWMAMNNLSASLLQGITWENDTTYIWNNRSYSVPQLMNGTAEEESNSSPVSCNIYWPENEYMNGQAAFTLYTFTLAFAIPLVLILVFYILVIRKLRTVGPSNKSKEKRRTQHRKVTRLVLTVVTVYVLCWLPYWVSQVSLIFTPPKSSQSQFMVTIFLLVGCLGYSNSAVNPILYAFLSDNFKKSFMKACVCAERREVNKALAAENSVFTRRGRNNSDGARLATATRNVEPLMGELKQSDNNGMLNAPCTAASCSPLSQLHSSPRERAVAIINHVNEVDGDVINDCQQDQQPPVASITHDSSVPMLQSTEQQLSIDISNINVFEMREQQQIEVHRNNNRNGSSCFPGPVLQSDL